MKNLIQRFLKNKCVCFLNEDRICIALTKAVHIVGPLQNALQKLSHDEIGLCSRLKRFNVYLIDSVFAV